MSIKKINAQPLTYADDEQGIMHMEVTTETYDKILATSNQEKISFLEVAQSLFKDKYKVSLAALRKWQLAEDAQDNRYHAHVALIASFHYNFDHDNKTKMPKINYSQEGL